MLNIKKKDGRVVPFRSAKILNDLVSAERVYGVEFKLDKQEVVTKLAEKLYAKGEDTLPSSVVFQELEGILEKDKPVLSAFREYKRLQQEELLNAMDVSRQIALLEQKDDAIIKENGNKDSRRFNTQRELLAGVVTKAKGLQMLPEEVKRAHIKGKIHFHDLDHSPYYAKPNCCLIDFEYLFAHGFNLGDAHITTPKSLKVAMTLVVQVIGAVSGEQYGGISVHEIDKLLKPYVRMTYDKAFKMFKEAGLTDEEAAKQAKKFTEKEVMDATQSLEYQINTLTTSSSQCPFTSVSFGLGTDWEEVMMQEALLKTRLNGQVDGSTSVFPKLLFFVKDGVNLKPADPLYHVKELAMLTSAKRTYPDMISMEMMAKVKPAKDGDIVRPITSMGCRSFLNRWYNEHGEEVIAGRNNAGVVSLNLGRLGIESLGDLAYFDELLHETMDIVISGLHYREKRVFEGNKEEAPLLYKEGALGEPKEDIRDYYRNNRATISVGYVGLHECMVALFGDRRWQHDPEKYAFAVSILERIQKIIDKNQDTFECYLSMYGTPAESLVGRFMKLDRQRYGDIPGVTDKEYYSNSFHYPSENTVDPMFKMEYESAFDTISTGGVMHYIEVPNILNVGGESQVLKVYDAMWNMAYDKVMYFGINSPQDVCLTCHYEGDFSHGSKNGDYECPHCHETINLCIVRRLCGYISKIGANDRGINHARKEEIAHRVKHVDPREEK